MQGKSLKCHLERLAIVCFVCHEYIGSTLQLFLLGDAERLLGAPKLNRHPVCACAKFDAASRAPLHAADGHSCWRSSMMSSRAGSAVSRDFRSLIGHFQCACAVRGVSSLRSAPLASSWADGAWRTAPSAELSITFWHMFALGLTVVQGN